MMLKPDFFYNQLPVGQNRFFAGCRKVSSSDDKVGVGNQCTDHAGHAGLQYIDIAPAALSSL